jgi:hypothetical protein
MTINVYKDGHSQILFRDKKKKRDLCVCVYNEQHKKKEERRIYTRDTYTRRKKKCVSSFGVLQFTDLLDQIGFFIIELFVIRTICMEGRQKIN